MSDSGHPRNFGYRKCRWCGCERRGDAVRFIDEGWECLDVAWCDSTPGAQRPVGGIPRGPVLNDGWDANGAPTGIDENGDAA